MKVAVITLKDSPNYGGILQAYALQRAVERMGHECVLIDYMNDEFRHKFTFFGRPGGMTSIYWIFKKVQYPLMAVMMKRMMPFYKHMNTTKHFDNPDELQELNEKYDVFITGSDQVWACDLNYYDASYFLDFVDSKHTKLAYAASFGRTVDMLKEEEKAFIQPRLDRFDSIGVREESGVDIVKALSGRDDSVPVLDPTFLLTKDEWEAVANHRHKGEGKRYVLCYLMQSYANDSEALTLAKKIAKERGLAIIKICRGLTSVLWGETMYIPTVEEWIGLFMDAEYIVTNSFHGMAFSVIFQKTFTSFIEGVPFSGRNSRIYDRCKDFGLLDRVCQVGKGERVDTKPIDFELITKRVEKRRNESICWLENAIITDSNRGGGVSLNELSIRNTSHSVQKRCA